MNIQSTHGFGLNTLRHTAPQNQSMRRLASGQRINSSSDDAAGLAISESMRGQIRGLNQASQNAALGQAMVQKADGVMGIITEMLQRVRELKVQGASDTCTAHDRNIIAIEIHHLTEGIGDIVRNTSWNGKSLFAPPNAGGIAGTDVHLQIGANSGDLMRVMFPDIYTNVFQVLSAQNANIQWDSGSSISGGISVVDSLLAFMTGAMSQVNSG